MGNAVDTVVVRLLKFVSGWRRVATGVPVGVSPGAVSGAHTRFYPVGGGDRFQMMAERWGKRKETK